MNGEDVTRRRFFDSCTCGVRRRCLSEDDRRGSSTLDEDYSLKFPSANLDDDRGGGGVVLETEFASRLRRDQDLPARRSSSGGRLSPYRLLANNRRRPPDLIVSQENDEKLFTVHERQEKYAFEDSNGRGYNKGLLFEPIVVKARRSVSPNSYGKLEYANGGVEKYFCDDRRVRARSESKEVGCAIYNSYGIEYCCKRSGCRNFAKCCPRDYHFRPSLTCGNKAASRRDVGVGDWSIYENVPAPPIEKHRVKINGKPTFSKNKQPAAKLKSRLLAIKAKKLLMETYSTGSDYSDDEISDGEDAASKMSLDRDSDQHECLTSDSGPSVSSTVSDSSSLNGLSSALAINAVVTSNEDLSSMLRPSLFPHVPPYLRFVSHDAEPLKPPSTVQRHLRWKMTTITPIVVKKTVLNSGFNLIRNDATQGECMDWVGTWGKHMKAVSFKGLRESQKVNHFPGTFHIGRKDKLWRNIQKLMYKFGSREFGLMPKTYVLPHDLKALKCDWDKYAAANEKWIIKPPAAARGTGIKVVARWTQIPKKRPVVVQHYIARPYLINDSKFDMRLYVVVTSIHPLRIYLYPDGLARFASVKYSDENNSLQDRFMHLTNYSINRLSKTYTHNQDAGACQGHKWTLQTLMNYLKTERGVNTKALWNSLKDLVIKTILSGESSITTITKTNIGSRFNCYELFGIDVLLDENLKPWLLEVNISPSLHSASPLDLHVKGPLISLLLNMAQFHVPAKVNMEELQKEKTSGPVLHDKRLYTVHLSKEEKAKHTHFTELENRKDYMDDILDNLTPDDVRHLIQAEDEFTQKGNLERIFPTPTTYKYFVYMAGPRYYNRLFDAWEQKFNSNRSAGIRRLQGLCEQGVHLEVPPMPAKNEDEESASTTPMQEESPPEEEEVTKNNEAPESKMVNSGKNDRDHCSLEGKHIMGEFCLVCRPTVPLLMNDNQPLEVRQHA